VFSVMYELVSKMLYGVSSPFRGIITNVERKVAAVVAPQVPISPKIIIINSNICAAKN
jgi:hypothetical protein